MPLREPRLGKQSTHLPKVCWFGEKCHHLHSVAVGSRGGLQPSLHLSSLAGHDFPERGTANDSRASVSRITTREPSLLPGQSETRTGFSIPTPPFDEDSLASWRYRVICTVKRTQMMSASWRGGCTRKNGSGADMKWSWKNCGIQLPPIMHHNSAFGNSNSHEIHSSKYIFLVGNGNEAEHPLRSSSIAIERCSKCWHFSIWSPSGPSAHQLQLLATACCKTPTPTTRIQTRTTTKRPRSDTTPGISNFGAIVLRVLGPSKLSI